jgi:hypothetical protein
MSIRSRYEAGGAFTVLDDLRQPMLGRAHFEASELSLLLSDQCGDVVLLF